MNPLTPQTVYVPVDVKTELPTKDGPIHTITPTMPTTLGQWYKQEYGFNDDEDYEHKVTHWLKPQSLYIFTRAELEEFVKNICDEAWGPDDSSLKNVIRKGTMFKNIIESIF